MRVRDWAREGIYRFLYALTGSGWGVRVIPFYHSVGSVAPHGISLQAFERQMEILTKHFKVVRLCDLPAAMASMPLETNIACVTFDDGYMDNYTVALPILERARIKGTFFIATGFMSKTFPTHAGEFAMMAPAQVRELAALGHEIGAHTMSHPKLTRVSLEAASVEIGGSKRVLEDLLGREVVSFAYPKGDHNAALIGLVGSLGFGCAVTTQRGLVNGHPDWLALPRVWISGDLTPKEFEARVSPAMHWYAKLRGQV